MKTISPLSEESKPRKCRLKESDWILASVVIRGGVDIFDERHFFGYSHEMVRRHAARTGCLTTYKQGLLTIVKLTRQARMNLEAAGLDLSAPATLDLTVEQIGKLCRVAVEGGTL